MKKWKNKGNFDILTDIILKVTLMQLMDALVIVNHAISILGYWIFDSNYDKELCLTRESLYLICSSSVGEKQVVNFETLFSSVIYMWSPGPPNTVNT